MAFKPRHELPVTGPDDPGSSWPSAMQLPIQTRKMIDASQNWFDNTQDPTTVADGIVDFYSASVSNFVATQRRDYSAGIIPVHSKFLNLPGLTLQYENRFGQERLSMTAYPESFTGGAQPDVEFNYDGYFSLTSLGQGQSTQIVYDFFVNGEQFGSYAMAENALGTVVFRFGATALRCQSLIDKSEGGPGNPNASTIGLVQTIVPSRTPIEAFTNNLGTQIAKHDDLPGYFIYGWESKLNNSGNAGSKSPPILSTIDFPDISKIPGFIKSGFNKFRVKPQSNFYPADTADLTVTAEFYCRDPSTYRLVSQSWTKAGSIVINDKPNYWRSASTIIPDIGIDVDLTATQNIKTTTPVANGTEDWTFNSTTGGDVGQPSNPPYDRGYWRPGDAPTAQAPPPNSPWQYAMSAAGLVVLIWQQILTLLEIQENDVGPNVPYFDYINGQITTAQAYQTTVNNTAAATNIYLDDGSAATSVAASEALLQAAVDYAIGAPPGPANPPTGLAYAPPFYPNGSGSSTSTFYNTYWPNPSLPAYNPFEVQAINVYGVQQAATPIQNDLNTLVAEMAAYQPP